MAAGLREISVFAGEVARGAAAIVSDGAARLDRVGVRFKGASNPVTEIDVRSEEYIRSAVLSRFPGHTVLGEEAGGAVGDDVWIVDPLDGTVNFMRGHPFYAVSIAYVRLGRPAAAAVAIPAAGDLFTAWEGGGAYRNGSRLRVSAVDSPDKALGATGFAYNRRRKRQNNVDNFSRLVMEFMGVRRCGAAVIDLAYVAAGIFDVFWELYLEPWDVAAGALLVTEAGGKVTDFSGGGDYIFGSNILASNGLIHEHVRSRLTPFSDEDAAPPR